MNWTEYLNILGKYGHVDVVCCTNETIRATIGGDIRYNFVGYGKTCHDALRVLHLRVYYEMMEIAVYGRGM